MDIFSELKLQFYQGVTPWGKRKENFHIQNLVIFENEGFPPNFHPEFIN